MDSKTNFKVARVVILFWMMGWFIKILFFGPYLLETAMVYPLRVSFFPSFFSDHRISAVFYFLPVCVLAVFFVERKPVFISSAALMLVCAAVMNLHVNTHNDATFVTTFWAALWLCWFVFRMDRLDESVALHGRFLVQCLLGMIFMAGTFGKLMDEFSNGEIIFNIFISQGEGSPLRWILGGLSPQLQGLVVAWISKVIIFSEGALILSPLLPFRWVVRLGICALPVITLFSTWRILSVLSPLIGLLVACSLWDKFDQKGQVP